MITPSFGLTATERVLPKLALDFTTASLDSRITFTRTTGASNPATYVNSSGIVTAATNNQPRFDYDPVTLACKGLLIEESRSNALTYSDAFNNAAWSPIRITVGADATTSPDGTANADALYETAVTNTFHIDRSSSFTPTASTAYTFSVFAKANGRDYIQLDWLFGGITPRAIFNLSTGQVSSTSAGTATITAFPNGWYRCTLTATTASTASGSMRLWISTDGTPSQSYAGDVTKGLYVYGAQLEAGAFATSYIPTTSAALTRNADVAVMTGTNFSDWFNASEGAFYVQGDKATTSITARTFLVNNGSATSQMYIGGGSTGLFVVTNTTTQAQIVTGTITANTTYSEVGSYKANDFKCAINGNSPGTDTSGTVPTVDRAFIGSDSGTTTFQNGHVAKVMYWPQSLTANEVRAFSKG